MTPNPEMQVAGVSALVPAGRAPRALRLLNLAWLRDRPLEMAVRRTRAALATCAALALTSASMLGTAAGPQLIRMAPPVLGLALALPLAMALWLDAISPRRARAVAQVAALALVSVGTASFERAAFVHTVLACFLPALLLLRAGDEVS